MMYAVVQKELQSLSADVLQAALPGVPGLTIYDAPAMARDAFGVLAEGMAYEAAAKFAAQLSAAGVPAVAVDESTLVKLPPPMATRRIHIQADGVAASDSFNTLRTYPLAQVVMLAVGKVECRQTTKKTVQERVGMTRRGQSIYRTHTEYCQSRDVPWIVELFLSVEPGRYALIPHGFLFDTLGGEITDDEEENYRRLAVKLLRAVPAATRNIGARKLETCGETQFYPSRHAFDEELRWRFWRGKTAE